MRAPLLGLLAVFAQLGGIRAADFQLRCIMLSTAGVGYFEYDATSDGAAPLGLDVRLDQVDDVLKSLVVWDDAGAVGGIELPDRAGARTQYASAQPSARISLAAA